MAAQKKVWFVLVDASSSALSSAFYVKVENNEDVVGFLYEVKRVYGDNHLAGIAPSDLRVYSNRAAFNEKKQPLAPGAALGTCGSSDSDTIVVEVPLNERQRDLRLVDGAIENLGDDRYEVELLVKALDPDYDRCIVIRLKGGTVVLEDSMEMRTCVHVKNPKIFCKCIEWKSKQIEKVWEDYYSMTPAAD
ncbi:hypothetical protein FI667_g2043, partial [Globisporangium splendens]